VRYYLATLLVLTLFGVPAVTTHFGAQIKEISSLVGEAGSQLAAVILSHNPKTISDLQAHYDQFSTLNATSSAINSSTTGATVSMSTSVPPKVRILIVPGHEPSFGGAEFKDLKERDMTVELANDLSSYLKTDAHYEVFQTRDAKNWNQDFADYFKNNWNDIIAWQRASLNETRELIKVGLSVSHSAGVPTKPSLKKIIIRHNVAPRDVAYRLYGITKWANDNNIDITIHIHFNDEINHGQNIPGKNSGFAIYVPDGQYGNSTTTKAVAMSVFKKLSEYNPVSDLPGESTGIVNEQNLIAIGADNTANSASMLIEYGYIYEPQFADPTTRSLALKDLAYQTYLGLEDFFNPSVGITLSRSYDTVALPYSWTKPILNAKTKGPDIFALQTALSFDGEYPPAGLTKNDCPRTGAIGACTEKAIKDFQNKYGVKKDNGIVGTKTLQLLNQNFGLQMI